MNGRENEFGGGDSRTIVAIRSTIAPEAKVRTQRDLKSTAKADAVGNCQYRH